ncbi:hypothetical protein ACE38W_15470 [Chitinophaga sp. Hz27]|uniref:HYC_CC_PP family protein n=1 Tax=Chitinophaga sp. Hz27 TaxID=3347169 RepID=UPI0035DE9957
MKKVFALILALLYIGTSSGATLHMHYCMGKLINVNLWHKEKVNKCSKCNSNAHMKCEKPCCKDTHKTLQVNKDHQVVNTTIDIAQMAVIAVPTYSLEQRPAHLISLVVAYPVGHAPPAYSKVPVHILHCTYRV